jgi:prevent-host-death family protein
MGEVSARSAAGERVVITRKGEPQAVLAPLDEVPDRIGPVIMAVPTVWTPPL